jgi:hypothetical protein
VDEFTVQRHRLAGQLAHSIELSGKALCQITAVAGIEYDIAADLHGQEEAKQPAGVPPADHSWNASLLSRVDWTIRRGKQFGHANIHAARGGSGQRCRAGICWPTTPSCGSDMQCGIEKKRGSGMLAIALNLSSVLVRFFIIVVFLPLFATQSALAQGDPRTRTDIDKALTEQLYREQQANRGCKIAVCEAARIKSARGDKIACHVAKTWPDIDIKNRFLKGSLDWPWGHAQCEGKFAVERQLIFASGSEPRYEVTVGKHDVVCHIDAKNGKDRHTVFLTIDPVVTFQNGKATKAALRWSNLSGPTIVKSALWSATAIDNTFNVLQGTLVDKINEFLGPGCDEALEKDQRETP